MRQFSLSLVLSLVLSCALFMGIVPLSVSEAGTSYSNRVIILGDSLTEGYGIDSSNAYPVKLEEALRKEGYSIKITNAGISGSTSASAPGRMQWLLRAKPTHLVLALGANDGLRGQSIENTRKNLIKTIDLALKHKIIVLLAGIRIPPNYGLEYSESFHRIYPQIAKEKAVALIPFLLKDVAGNPELNIEDGIHPNVEGHKIITETVRVYLAPLLIKE